MREITPIEKGRYYHIYNRGINGEDIFKEEKNYDFFLKKWATYIDPIAETYAYCLLKNHFHFLVYIREEDVFSENGASVKLLNPSLQFSHLYNSYAQSINKVYSRTGALFEHPFRRKMIDSESYFCKVVAYIHTNPQKHGFVDDFKFYPHSSYGRVMDEQPTFISKDKLITWFNDKDNYKEFHSKFKEEMELKSIYFEE